MALFHIIAAGVLEDRVVCHCAPARLGAGTLRGLRMDPKLGSTASKARYDGCSALSCHPMPERRAAMLEKLSVGIQRFRGIIKACS
jgi:hypothetical protein